MTDVPTFGYEYQVGGSLPVDAPTYVRRQADTDRVHPSLANLRMRTDH
jgi:hypothetical protein